MNRRLRHPRRSRGQTLVEFALVVPIVILLILAVFDLGRGVFAYSSTTNAAREGARLAIVNQDVGLVEDRVRKQSAVAETDETDGTGISVNFFLADAAGNPTTTDCPSAGGISIGCLAVVRYETTFEPITPLIGQILFGSGVTLTAESVLPVEFTCPNATVVATACPKQP